jgi:hypothetical protein
MRLAPVLHELAGRLSGRPCDDARTQPTDWAYALRDAVEIAHPDVLISHWDPSLEADALRVALRDGEGDWVDRLLDAQPLAYTPPTEQAVLLVGTLARLFPAGPQVAAVLTGPVTVAAALAAECLDGGLEAGANERMELADLCADALAGLLGAYADAGASLIVVAEPHAGFVSPAAAAEAQLPLARALAHRGLGSVLVAPPGVDLASSGYDSIALRWDGFGPPPSIGLAAPELWGLPPARFQRRWSELVGEAAGADVLLLSDGPLPADMPLENFRTARGAATQSVPGR